MIPAPVHSYSSVPSDMVLSGRRDVGETGAEIRALATLKGEKREGKKN